ncbi:hypothetical protein [Runella sp.]|uniref:hypothetical protein n=1 Tax=Runella sp. TaxID=1960881 RepID=UPI003D14C573
MRTFETLDYPLKRKILDRYIKNEIGFEELEAEYNVTAESFKKYMVETVESQYNTFKPVPKSSWKEDFKILFRKFRDNLLTDLIVKFTLLFFLFKACVVVPAKLADTITPLGALAIEKAGITLLVFLIGKMFFELFTLVTDRKEWFYATAFIRPEFGFDNDFNNLTPFQRCTLSLLKRSVRMLIYALLFLGILMQ